MLSNLWFRFLHQNFLIYNTSWEDPRIDRELLDLDQGSKVLMITGAGDNVLDYLLDSPSSIHTVDLNYRQNALLKLKLKLIEKDEYDLLWQVFGKGCFSDSLEQIIYELDSQSAQFLIQHFRRLNGKSFYFSGSSGLVARFISRLIRNKGLMPIAESLFECSNLEEQRVIYNEFEERLFNDRRLRWMNQSWINAFLGIPKSQHQQSGNTIDFIKTSMRKVFTQTPARENYFWRVYLFGEYSKECCPSYLKAENWDLLKQNYEKVQVINGSLTQHLNDSECTYSHIVLLDHMDWFAKDHKILNQLWSAIFRKSKPDSKILFRSIYDSPEFIPEEIRSQIYFDNDQSEYWQPFDRVGTYRSTSLAIYQERQSLVSF